jgi:hypothetical protein
MDPTELEAKFKAARLARAVTGDDLHGHFRLSHNDFISNETRNENSMKFVAIWCEAFLLTAIAHSFGAVLSSQNRKQLSALLQAKIEEKKSDFVTYQKNKKKA